MFISSGYSCQDRLFGTQYDDAGYYRLDSLRNLKNCVVFSVLGGWVAMLLVPELSGRVAGVIDWSAAQLLALFYYRLENLRLW